ncbi:hypothetical protein [Methylobacterium iners]|uniref:Uncharacterized protein n=1 Tax=Methylobacterium iners TaxID=418707 RepID=A0ABQ4RQA0_9HYPH|nr:hypothetical protein [Methylobacterium iners]GJD92931.1 hypothetical protein OCOJLMKI_0114 [Methylobacterium iners]
MARQMTNPRMGHAEHKRNHYRCVLEIGTSVEEVLHPMFFMNISGVKPGDIIECVREDLSGMIVLLVRAADRTAIKTGIVSGAFFDDELERPEAPAEDFRTEFNVQDKWRVVRISDGEVLTADLPSEAAAKKWLTNHRKTIG